MYFQMKNILKNNHNHTPKHIFFFFGFWLISPLKSCNSEIFLINFLKSKTTRNISFLYFFFSLSPVSLIVQATKQQILTFYCSFFYTKTSKSEQSTITPLQIRSQYLQSFLVSSRKKLQSKMIYVKSKNTLTIPIYKNNSIKNHNLKTDKESKVATVVLGLL